MLPRPLYRWLLLQRNRHHVGRLFAKASGVKVLGDTMADGEELDVVAEVPFSKDEQIQIVKIADFAFLSYTIIRLCICIRYYKLYTFVVRNVRRYVFCKSEGSNHYGSSRNIDSSRSYRRICPTSTRLQIRAPLLSTPATPAVSTPATAAKVSMAAPAKEAPARRRGPSRRRASAC